MSPEVPLVDFAPLLRRAGLALVAAGVSVVSFLALAVMVGGYNAALSTVVKADIVALLLLVVAAVVHLRGTSEA